MAITAPLRHPRQQGEKARDHIQRILAEWDAQGKAPTLDELVELTGLTKTPVRHHVEWLQSEGKVYIEDARREIRLVKPSRTEGEAAS